jgi:DNA polymerase/3'-5' exonuclease PolX
MPLTEGLALANALAQYWHIPDGCWVVGSLRRGVPAVASIDLTAPVPTEREDPLFEAIQSCMSGAGGLFAAPSADGHVRGRVVSGLAPHFQRARLIIEPVERFSKHPMPVDIYRFRESNRGIVELMATGPRSFVDLFWHRWRKQHAIPEGLAHKCMRDGDLVDGDGNVVRVETEFKVFEAVGWKFTDPRQRATIGQGAAHARKRAQGA